MDFHGDAVGFALEFIREHLLGGDGTVLDDAIAAFPEPSPPAAGPVAAFPSMFLPQHELQQQDCHHVDRTREYVESAAPAAAEVVMLKFGGEPSPQGRSADDVLRLIVTVILPVAGHSGGDVVIIDGDVDWFGSRWLGCRELPGDAVELELGAVLGRAARWPAAAVATVTAPGDGVPAAHR
uniref:Uncharacterized protein n=1 Tax=Oryza brachyantha TaxID=4533 RepID=J3M044_ORYBR